MAERESGPQHWPWPAPGETVGDPVPGGEQGTGQPFQQVVAPGGPSEQPPAPGRRGRRRRDRRRGVAVPAVAALTSLALLVGTLLGLVLAPRFGIETLADQAPGAGPADPTGPSDPSSPVPSTLPQPPSTGGPAATGGIDVTAIAAAALPSTVTLQIPTPDGMSRGSGFVLREDGHILTNAHVVAYAAESGAEITVVFSDGEQAVAELVGLTGDYDLAVVRVDRTDLVPLPLGDSDAVAVGNDVVAVGAPLGLQGTVTAGIVSALNRPVQAGEGEQTSFINAIQTDAAINPGNSGGPLLDSAGRVIGINSAIAQPQGVAAGGSIGLGFAIPSNQARRTAEQLIATGVATYPVIGVLLDSTYTGVGVKVAIEPSNGTEPLTPGEPPRPPGSGRATSSSRSTARP
ncbi:S1C family serine protease [Litorihabitans aurantiacus]|uniref:Serine protease PepD n=1 Tax=Litorihabitans aurantiacus TaxID=1930061 RepID=A0AA37XF51_9MICO|nr:trypsin-like peptidase domain-containing protein [Litorihabitans aurantiacus]GMA32147.1 hypothetical protein GCM10025875_21390 [Litorihabitans aurantiacus]